ncbi:MAG: single-stranded-DNA-specific exonuclease RecJ [Deltaproteobacteria bacterium]|nr:single-stranded-DNA-specific exonuclease RecJ [Deltaproteobacteria bacterium]
MAITTMEVNPLLSQESLKIPDFLLKFLIARGFKSSQEIKEFLYPKISTLSDPFLVLNMDKAVQRLLLALDSQEKIAIYGDYDLDGTFGLILLKEGLEKLGFKFIIPFQPLRHRDGYGLHSHYVEEIKSRGCHLILTVDVGITANEACDKAKDLGVDVIVTDHHLPQDRLPSAFCIVNPNQEGDKSGLNYLCGAGVALYLIRALRKKMLDLGYSTSFDIKELLPYYAIATITDMVPLIKDNRLLLKFAFESFKKVENKGLTALLSKLDLKGKKLDVEDIGIKLAPKINALGRLEKDKQPMELLFLENEIQANAYVEELLDLNTKRRAFQDKGVNIVEQHILENNLEESIKRDHFLYFFSDKIHPGVTGLIANHFMTELGVACLIGSVNPETGTVISSGRKPEDSPGSLVEFISSIKSETCDGGGHSCAIGFEFHLDEASRIHKLATHYFLKNQLDNQLDIVIEKPHPEHQLKFDAEINWKDLHFKNYLWLEFMEPFGVGFEEPRFLIKNVSFIQLTLLKNKHFKLVAIDSSHNEKNDFLLFNPNSFQRRLITEGLDNLDVVVKIKRDKFRNQNKIQLLIEDVCRHESFKN